MKRVLFFVSTAIAMLVAALSMASCSNSAQKQQEQPGQQDALSEVNSQNAVDSTAVKQEEALSGLKAELAIFVEDPNKATIPYSADYKNTLKKADAAGGEMGFYDYDFWTQSQDPDNPKWTLDSVEADGAGRAIAEITLTERGERTKFKLTLIQEGQQWAIDDVSANGEETEKTKMTKFIQNPE